MEKLKSWLDKPASRRKILLAPFAVARLYISSELLPKILPQDHQDQFQREVAQKGSSFIYQEKNKTAGGIEFGNSIIELPGGVDHPERGWYYFITRPSGLATIFNQQDHSTQLDMLITESKLKLTTRINVSENTFHALNTNTPNLFNVKFDTNLYGYKEEEPSSKWEVSARDIDVTKIHVLKLGWKDFKFDLSQFDEVTSQNLS